MIQYLEPKDATRKTGRSFQMHTFHSQAALGLPFMSVNHLLYSID